MQHVYWIGGSPCAGKTTIAHIIAQEYGWQTYHIDRHVEQYLARAIPEKHTALAAYQQGGLKQFLARPPAIQLDDVKAISHEQFEFVLADLDEMDSSPPILVEGANMLPEDVAKCAANPDHIIWLVPTEAFQLKTYPRRGTWVQDVLRHNFAEDQRLDVFDNWMQRDALMARWTAQDAHKAGIRVHTVDGSLTIRETAIMVVEQFGLPLSDLNRSSSS